MLARKPPTFVVRSPGDNQVGVSHQRLYEVVEVFANESIVSRQNGLDISASVVDVSDDYS